MRVFLAGPSREIDRVWAARKALIDMGVECSSSWIDPVAEMRAAGKRDLDLSDAEKLSAARSNFRDIRRSDALWLLYPKATTYSRGTGPEVGYALAMGRPVVVSGHDARDDIYAAFAEARFDSDTLAAAWFAERVELHNQSGIAFAEWEAKHRKPGSVVVEACGPLISFTRDAQVGS